MIQSSVMHSIDYWHVTAPSKQANPKQGELSQRRASQPMNKSKHWANQFLHPYSVLCTDAWWVTRLADICFAICCSSHPEFTILVPFTVKAMMQTCVDASSLDGIQTFALCASKKGRHFERCEVNYKSIQFVSRLYSGQTTASMAWQLGSSPMI